MGYTFSQLPRSTGFPEVLGVSHRQTEMGMGGQHHSGFRVLFPEHPCSPPSLWSMLYSLTTLLLSHLSVIHTPPCLFRPLAHGTLFLPNSSATVTLRACSVSVIYDSNTQTNCFDFHYPVDLYLPTTFLTTYCCWNFLTHPASKISPFNKSLSDHNFPSFFLSFPYSWVHPLFRLFPSPVLSLCTAASTDAQ